MPRDYITIGSEPCLEPSPQVGQDDYAAEAQKSCHRFIRTIRKALGEEPEGARLAVKANPHDFGTYYEVVCHFDDADEEATRYAFKCEAEAPEEWLDEVA